LQAVFAAGHAVLGRGEDMVALWASSLGLFFQKKKIFTRKVTFVAFIKSGII
jgi:hypothetical protein